MTRGRTSTVDASSARRPAPASVAARLRAFWRTTPWWLVALCGIGAIAGREVWVDAGYRAILDIVGQGISITAFVTVTAFTLATLIGLLVALAGRSSWVLVRQSARFYSETVRGIPVLVLLLYMAFVATPGLVAAYNAVTAWPQRQGWLDALQVRDVSLTWRAIIALSIAYSAFIAEVVRAGLQSVDGGQIEAASALGLSRFQVMRLVRFPLALRTILPPLGNDFIALIKDSALVSVFGVGDITQHAKVYASGSFQFFETYNVVTLIYLVMTIGLSLALRALERRLLRSPPAA